MPIVSQLLSVYQLFSQTFGQKPYIVQTIPILIYILKIDNTFELFILGTDAKNKVNSFKTLRAQQDVLPIGKFIASTSLNS